MRKPTYYPEIDTLNISEEEKLRLDKLARKNVRNHINQNNCKKLPDAPSMDDMELLKSIGIVKKKYSFKCPYCNFHPTSITEECFLKYCRLWELEEKIQNEHLNKKEKEELDVLYENGYSEFYAYCDNCEEEVDISKVDEFQKYKENFEPFYTIDKVPNLKYEKL